MGANGEFVPTTLGLALIEAYNSMRLAFKLSAPQLRAKMEKDMNNISQKVSTKNDVLKTNAELYRNLFLQVINEADKLDRACAKYFDPIGTSFTSEKNNFSTCGHCGALMSLRTTEQTQVLFCKNCNKSLPVPSIGNLQPLDHRCPLCRFQVLCVQKETSSYNICPWCYSNPPNGQNVEGNFPCFTCSEKTCPLAKKVTGDPVRPCPRCSKPMALRKKKDSSGYFLGCTGFPQCKAALSMPEAESISVSEQCPSCSTSQAIVRMLEFHFNRNQVSYSLPLEYIACVAGCNETINERLQLVNKGNLSEFLSPIRVDTNTMNRIGSKRPAPSAIVSSYERLQSGLSSSLADSGPPWNSTIHVNDTEEENSMLSMPRKRIKATPPTQYHKQQSSVIPASSSAAFDECGEVPFCGCQQPAVIRTSGSSANPGRQFYTCGRPREEQCGLFVWVDEWDGNPNPPIKKKGDGSAGGGLGSHGRAGSSSAESGLSCYKCGQVGHFATNCTQSTRSTSGAFGGHGRAGSGSTENGLSCYKCGQVGHFATNCPQATRSTGGATGGQTCFRCGQVGHFANNCPQTGSPGHKEKKSQFRVRGDGHRQRAIRKCSQCGQPGHTKRSCPNVEE